MSRYNVRAKKGKAGELQDFATAHGLKHVPHEHAQKLIPDWRVFELPPGIAKKDEEAQIKWLAHHDLVDLVEPEGFGEVILPPQGQSVPDDTEVYQDFLRLDEAHTLTKGKGQTVAVFDNGLNPPAAWVTPVIGEQKLFRATETNGVIGGSHGQPVTYLVFAGAPLCVCTNYKIASAVDVRCSWNDVAEAIAYALSQGLAIGNLSYGGGSSTYLADMLRKAREAGFALFVACGNSGDATQFPANNPNVYAVAALNTGSTLLASFSCRGKVELACPGTNLLTCNSSGGWSTFSGTSGATPLASGMAALIRAQNPTWSGVQCADHLVETATRKTAEGYPIPDAAVAVGAAAPPPPEPINLNGKASWSCLTPYTADGLARLIDDQPGTACLWKSASPWIRAAFAGEGATVVAVDLTCTNATVAYPQRNPSRLAISADGSAPQYVDVPAFAGSYKKQRVPVTPISGAKFEITLFAGSGNLLEAAGLALMGFTGGTVPAPTPDPEPPQVVLPDRDDAALTTLETDWPTLSKEQRTLAKDRFASFAQ